MAEIYTPEIPHGANRQRRRRHAAHDYVVNVLMPSAFPSGISSNLPDVRPLAPRFYRNFADDFDVLDIVFAGPSFFQNRFHFAVQNTVQGIGVGILNNAASYGSVGRLLGIS